MTTTAHSGGPTPPQEDQPANVYAGYVPHDLQYSADFEDSLIDIVLHSAGTGGDGIRVIPEESDEQAIDGVSVRAKDILPQSLPTLREEDLPLPLDDPRRKFTSPIPGIRLTHPYGYLEGGPPLQPDLDTFADDFLSNHSHVSNPEQLSKAVQKEVDASIELLKERLRARQKAKEKNEQIAKDLKVLTDQHDMELRIHERMQEEQRRKKEAREKTRSEKQAG